MFAVGSNPEAANVSGVNVVKTTIMVHTLAGMMYGITGFIESARIAEKEIELLTLTIHNVNLLKQLLKIQLSKKYL